MWQGKREEIKTREKKSWVRKKRVGKIYRVIEIFLQVMRKDEEFFRYLKLKQYFFM